MTAIVIFICILMNAVYQDMPQYIHSFQRCIWSLYLVWRPCTAHITAGLVRIQPKHEIIWLSPSPFRAVMFPPVQSWKHWPPGYSAFLGSDCGTFTRNSLFVCLVHRVHSAWVVFARSLEPSWVAERAGEWPGLLWRRRGTAAWRFPHSNPLIYCSSPRVCSPSLSIRKILVAKGGPP